MAGTANFAFANRQLSAHLIRGSCEEELAGKFSKFHLRHVYDIAHNMARIQD